MARIEANGIGIEYELEGPKGAPVVLLVMGLAAQLTAWPPALLERLHGAGFRTLRFDNRDAGLSEKMEGRRAPNLPLQAILSRLNVSGLAPYNLRDIAADAEGLMAALGVERAHVVGVSMGGMIAQVFAGTRPARTLSFAGIMTTTNRPRLPGARRDVAKTMFGPGPVAATEEAAIERGVRIWRLIGSPDGGEDEAALRARVTAAVRRSNYPAGIRRQTAAIVDEGDLRRYARRIAAPTLVIHGEADPLVRIEGGADLAACVPGARFERIEGMGHDLAPRHLPRIAELLIGHVEAAEAAARVGA